MSDIRDWTPVRKGDIYCSPACGAGCKHSDFLLAMTEAHRLVARCISDIGGAWRTDVWENLGWHWRVKHLASNIVISDSRGRYLIGLGGGTPSDIHLPTTFETPKDAWEAQVSAITNEAHKWIELLQSTTIVGR